jgi:hypothetical protein
VKTKEHLFSGFMAITFGFSGTLIQDFSQFFTPQLAEAASAVPTEDASVVSQDYPVLPKDCSIQEQEEAHPLVDTLPLYKAKVDTEEPPVLPDQCAVYNKEETITVSKEEEILQVRVESLEKMTKGHPLADMSQEIARLDPEIAALVVGIAKKESNWGKRSPQKKGSDCFNYWGFKGAGERGVGMGHACFATREEAVAKIAKRLERLVEKRGTSKPSALVTTWKCGSSCAGHSKESVNKWVSDVNSYYSKVLAMN